MGFFHDVVGHWSSINLFLLFTCPLMGFLGGLVKIAYLYVNLRKIPNEFKSIKFPQNITSPEFLKISVDYVLNSFRYCVYLFEHPKFIVTHLFVSTVAGFVCSLFYLGLFQDSPAENFQFVRAWFVSLIAGSAVDHIFATREKLIQSLLTSPQIRSHFRNVIFDEIEEQHKFSTERGKYGEENSDSIK